MESDPLIAEPNLLITFDPEDRRGAHEEVASLLAEVGEPGPEFLRSGIEGVFMLKTTTNPKEISKKMRAVCKRTPSKFWYTYRWIPIERGCTAGIEEMEAIVKELAERIGPTESWLMAIHKRDSPHQAAELIDRLARRVDRPKVDLRHPQKTIQIEIVRDWAGLSLLRPEELFSVREAKEEALK